MAVADDVCGAKGQALCSTTHTKGKHNAFTNY